MYGLAVVGLTKQGVKQLNAYEAKHVRAIAKAPAHVYKERTEDIFKRLGYTSPVETMLKYLVGIQQGRRGLTCSWHETALASLREVLASMGAGVIEAPMNVSEIACPVCVVYFGGVKAMKIHLAKMHQESFKVHEDAQARREVDFQWMGCRRADTAS